MPLKDHYQVTSLPVSLSIQYMLFLSGEGNVVSALIPVTPIMDDYPCDVIFFSIVPFGPSKIPFKVKLCNKFKFVYQLLKSLWWFYDSLLGECNLSLRPLLFIGILTPMNNEWCFLSLMWLFKKWASLAPYPFLEDQEIKSPFLIFYFILCFSRVTLRQ